MANSGAIHCSSCYSFFKRELAEFDRSGDVFELHRRHQARLQLVGNGLTQAENVKLLGQGTLLCYYCGSRDVEFLSKADSTLLKAERTPLQHQ
jgi:hypothetical protein